MDSEPLKKFQKQINKSAVWVFSLSAWVAFAQDQPPRLVTELGFGKTFNLTSLDEIHGHSVSGLFDLEFPKHNFYSQLQIRGIVDDASSKENIDEDRHSLWFSGRIEIGKFFERDEAMGRDWGLRLRTEINENTPTSTERAISVDVLPTLRFFKDKSVTELSLGVSAFSHELDDDLPRSQGFERDRLSMDTLGLICQVNSSLDLGKNFFLNFSAKAVFDEKVNFFETRVGTSLDIPLNFLEGQTCLPYFRIGAEYRHFDLDDRSGALPFDNEVFVTADFIVRFGGSKSDRHFYRSYR